MPHGSIARTAELVIVSLFVTCSAFADCLDFAAARTYPGFRRGLVAVADFNGDGKKDVALSGSLLLGTGNGSFSTVLEYPIGQGTGGLVVAGDFNGDGKSDLINAGRVLIGHGDGTFSAPAPLPASGDMSVAIGDFNADGRSDVATITSFGRLTILLGNGDGTFAVSTHYDVGGWAVVAADLNGDGKIDVAVAAPGAGVTVLLGKGDGTFASGVSYAPGVFHPTSVDVADLNGDGRLDLIAGAGGDGSVVAVFPGKGDGTFGAAVLTSFPDFTRSVKVADLDADGKPDVVVSSGSTLYVYRGTGRLSLDSLTTYPISYSPSFLIDDLNADGKLDVLLEGGIMFGRGDGTFTVAIGARGEGTQLALGDFNADGRVDIAMAASIQGIGSAGVTILLGNGNATFAQPVLYLTPQRVTYVAVGDMNGDGKSDLIEACEAPPGGTEVFLGIQLGNGDGTFGAIRKYPLPPGHAVTVSIADFNGDHRNDVVLVAGGGIAVLLNQGDGTLTAPTQYMAGPGSLSVTVADFNGDGKIDLAVTDYFNYWVSILLGRGDGTFGSAVNYPVFPLTPVSITTADFNGDGIPDLATGTLNTGIAVLLGKGDGSFAPATFYYYGGSYTSSVAAADFNGDGIVDLAVGDRDSDAISIFLGKGDGTFASPVNYGSGNSPTSVRAADFDGDGRADVVAATDIFQGVAIILNKSSCASIASVSPASGSNAGQEMLTVRGSGLSGAVSATLDGAKARILANTPTSITLFTPEHPPGSVDVTVATAGGNAKAAGAYTYVIGTADVNVTMALGGSPPLFAGSTLTYTINVGNSGPGAASQVVVTDAIPAGAVLVSVSPSQGTCSGVAPITCAVGPLANGATATIKIAVRSGLTPSAISNTATVVSAQNDPNPSNNSATSTAQTASASTIPTLSLTALVLLSLGLALVASVAMRR